MKYLDSANKSSENPILSPTTVKILHYFIEFAYIGIMITLFLWKEISQPDIQVSPYDYVHWL